MQPFMEPRKIREKVVDRKGTIELHDGTLITGKITLSEDYASAHLQNERGSYSYPTSLIRRIRWPSETKVR
jgi:hypothetical protein